MANDAPRNMRLPCLHAHCRHVPNAERPLSQMLDEQLTRPAGE